MDKECQRAGVLRRFLRVAFSLVVGLAALSACSLGSDGDDPGAKWKAGWSPSWTTVWSSEPGLASLRSHPGSLVRAAYESFWMSSYYGSEYSFPGYLGSIPSWENMSVGFFPNVVEEKLSWNATNYVHVTGLVVTADRVEADLCMVRRWSSEDPDYRTRVSEARIISPSHIEFDRRDVARETGDPERSYSDPAVVNQYSGVGVHQGQVPSGNVFSGWDISSMKADQRYVTYACANWATTVLPESHVVGVEGRDLAIKGPDVPQPLQPQFPRWE